MHAASDPLDCKQQSASITERRRPARQRLLAALWLVAMNLAVFGQTIDFEFLNWDDREYVVPHLERFGGLSAESVRWAFVNRENGWRTPIAYLSLFLDTQLYGVAPSGLHVTNVLIHTMSTWLLFLALDRMTRQWFLSLLAATIFAIHPLHVEPVAWITGRWELLCGLFWIAGMWCYARYCESPGIGRYMALLAAFCCALLSKPMALTFPFALLLLDYWPLQRLRLDRHLFAASGRPQQVGIGRAVLEKTPLFLVMGAAAILFWTEKAGFVASRGMLHFSLVEKLLNAAQTYAIYTVQLVWPTRLSFFYLHPVLTGGFDTWQLAAALLMLTLITVWVVRQAAARRYLLVGWLWFLGVFVPAIGFLQVEHHARADRYTYLPSIGLILLVCWGVAEVARFHRAWFYVLCGTLVSGLAVAAHVQTSHWRSSRSLFEYGIRVDPQNYKAHINLGNILTREGKLRKAEECYERGVAIWPHDYLAVNNLGIIKFRLGDLARAQQVFERLQQVPADLPAHYLLPVCLVEDGRHDAALACAQEQLRNRPHSSLSHGAMAYVLAKAGRWPDAEKHYQAVLAREPDRSAFALQLSDVLARHRAAAAPASAPSGQDTEIDHQRPQ